jgi:hypothetical protein
MGWPLSGKGILLWMMRLMGGVGQETWANSESLEIRQGFGMSRAGTEFGFNDFNGLSVSIYQVLRL